MSVLPGLALCALASLALAPAAAAQEEDCVATTEEGETFPTCFDPRTGLLLGAGAAGTLSDDPGGGWALELRGGILFRTERASRSKKDSLWINEGGLLLVRAQPQDPLREMTATLFEGTFRRHIREGFILVPTPGRPTRLPFPFDVALRARVATWERRIYDGPGFTFEVARLALMLDPTRSRTGRFHAAVGPAVAYAVRTDGETWTHELTPFTSAAFDLGAETEDGWWSVRLQGIAGWVSVPGAGTFFRASGRLEVDRLVFAVNDQPIWLNLSVAARKRDAGVYRATELTASLGLAMRAFQ